MEDNIYEFKATITYNKYYNEDSCWGTCIFKTESEIPYYDAEMNEVGKVEYVCNLVGKMQELQIGATYLVKATYNYHEKYGHQYNPIAIYAVVPKSRDEQLLLLQSIIPLRLAENLINAYPNIVEDVVNCKINTIDFSKVNGIRELTWNRIKNKILDNYIISDIIVVLKPLGVTFAMIKKLIEEEPNPMLLKQQLENNPYIVTKIKGIGFSKADEFALRLKPELLESTERLVAFVNYYLSEIGESDGHTWISVESLKSAINANVPQCADKMDWLLANDNFLYIEGDKVGLARYNKIEERIYNYLKEKKDQYSFEDLLQSDIDRAVKQAEDEQGYKYTEEQLQVINNTLHSNVSIITGCAGSGKTSLMRAILKAYYNANKNVCSCALSAMAAQRIKEASGYPAATIHRTLGCQGLGRFLHNKDNPLCCDVVLVDETSMIGANLFLSLLEAVGNQTRIIICGDYKQLPPIGYGNIFSDLINGFKKYNCVNELTKPMRQALKSGILADANLIRNNKNPITEPLQPKLIHGELQDMYYMFRDNREQLHNIAIKTFLSTVEKEGIDNVAIVVPRKQGCINSTEELNKEIQEKMLGNELNSIEHGQKEFKLGAKVMQIVNDYERNVFNGEIGIVVNIYTKNINGKSCKFCDVEFEDNKIVSYQDKDINDLDLAYALTTHKIQGCGIKTIICIIDNTHYKLLDNCMLYTMLTRAKKKCLLLAEISAISKCIKTSHNERNTWLKIK